MQLHTIYTSHSVLAPCQSVFVVCESSDNLVTRCSKELLLLLAVAAAANKPVRPLSSKGSGLQHLTRNSSQTDKLTTS